MDDKAEPFIEIHDIHSEKNYRNMIRHNRSVVKVLQFTFRWSYVDDKAEQFIRLRFLFMHRLQFGTVHLSMFLIHNDILQHVSAQSMIPTNFPGKGR